MSSDWVKMNVRTVLKDQIDLLLEKQKEKPVFISGHASNPTQFLEMALREKLEKEAKKE